MRTKFRGDPSARLVWYSNGGNNSICQVVRLSDGIQNPYLFFWTLDIFGGSMNPSLSTFLKYVFAKYVFIPLKDKAKYVHVLIKD